MLGAQSYQSVQEEGDECSHFQRCLVQTSLGSGMPLPTGQTPLFPPHAEGRKGTDHELGGPDSQA